MNISDGLKERLLQAQQSEITEYYIYKKIASRLPDNNQNKKIVLSKNNVLYNPLAIKRKQMIVRIIFSNSKLKWVA